MKKLPINTFPEDVGCIEPAQRTHPSRPISLKTEGFKERVFNWYKNQTWRSGLKYIKKFYSESMIETIYFRIIPLLFIHIQL